LTRTLGAAGVERVGSAWAALACLLALCVPGAARAEWLAVERVQGAENCPDAATVGARVQTIRAGGQGLGPTPRDAYQIRFRRADDTLVAELRRAANAAHVRTLTVRGESCEPLAEAAAVALALLLDAEPSARPPPAPASTPAPAGSVATHRPPPPTPLRGSLALGAGALFGVTRLVAPALEGELGLWHARFRASLGVLGVPVHREPFGAGSLRSWQLAGSAKGCLTPVTAARLRLDLCSGLYAGVLDVRARGYTRNDQRKQAWLAVPVEVSGHVIVGPVALALAVSALFPIRRPEFSIEGLGSAFDAWPVSLLIALKLVTVLPVFEAPVHKE
jgi:hypothetical protein